MTATEQIMKCVQDTRISARDSESIFEREISRVQRMARRTTIDLFGGEAISQVAEIITSAQKACDDLYATLQMLVRMIDEKCRPLLVDNPDITAVREVVKVIEWLNEESEIKNNFTASLNGSDMGDIGVRQYMVPIESKMIQRYW